MKIIDERNKKLVFKDLRVGDVFRDEYGIILMKTHFFNGFNAVGLNNGELYGLTSDYEVIEVLNTVLVIKN